MSFSVINDLPLYKWEIMDLKEKIKDLNIEKRNYNKNDYIYRDVISNEIELMNLLKRGNNSEDIEKYISLYRNYDYLIDDSNAEIVYLFDKIDVLQKLGLERESLFNELRKKFNVQRRKDNGFFSEYDKATQQLRKMLENRGFYEKKIFNANIEIIARDSCRYFDQNRFSGIKLKKESIIGKMKDYSSELENINKKLSELNCYKTFKKSSNMAFDCETLENSFNTSLEEETDLKRKR